MCFAGKCKGVCSRHIIQYFPIKQGHLRCKLQPKVLTQIWIQSTTKNIPKLTHDWLILLIGNSIMTSDELDLCHLLIDDIYR